MFEVWLQMSDTNFDRKNPSDLPALVCVYFNTFLKCQQNFTTGMLCTKTISGMQNKLNITTYVL